MVQNARIFETVKLAFSDDTEWMLTALVVTGDLASSQENDAINIATIKEEKKHVVQTQRAVRLTNRPRDFQASNKIYLKAYECRKGICGNLT